jgi:hypothetical protein
MKNERKRVIYYAGSEVLIRHVLRREIDISEEYALYISWSKLSSPPAPVGSFLSLLFNPKIKGD